MKHQKKKHRKVTVSHISSTFTYFVESLLYSFQFIKYNIIVIAVELNSYSVWQKSQNGLNILQGKNFKVRELPYNSVSYILKWYWFCRAPRGVALQNF